MGVAAVGEDNVGVTTGSVEGQEGRFVLAPRPDDDEPLEEFKLVLLGDVGDKLIRLLMELERREIVSKLSGIGRKICASGLNGRMGTSESRGRRMRLYGSKWIVYLDGMMVLHVLHYHLMIHC